MFLPSDSFLASRDQVEKKMVEGESGPSAGLLEIIMAKKEINQFLDLERFHDNR